MTASDLEQRLAELEALVEEHARQLQHEETERSVRRGVSRRSILQSLGVIGLGGYAAGRATADPQGQLGTSTDPVREVYTNALNGGVTGGASVTDLLGDGLAETGGTLEADVADATNRGNGSGVFGGNTDGTLGFRSLVGGNNISLSSTSDEVTIDADTVGERNTASNAGSGAGLFKGKTGVDLAFRSLTTSGALAVTENTDTVSLEGSWEDANGDDLLEPANSYTGIDVTTAQADEIQGAGGTTHLTLTNGGPLALNQTLDTDGNTITNNAGNVTLASVLDLSANDLVDGGTTIWDTSTGYIPQGRLENDTVTVSAGDGLKNGGSIALGASTTLDIEPADFAGTFLSDDGTDDLTVDIGNGLENDGSDNLRVDPGGVAGNGLTEDTATTLGIATGGVDTTELADSSVTSAKVASSAITAAKIATDAVTTTEIGAEAVTTSEVATDAVTGTEIDLNDIAGENVTVDGTNDELDAAPANMVDADTDGYLEPDGFNGIDSPVVRTPEIRDAGDSTHLTLTNGGPLTLNQSLDTDGNALTNNAGDVSLGSILDLSANDLVDGGTTIWDTSTGYIPQGRLENATVTVTAGDGLKNGGSVALGNSTTLDIEPTDFAGTFLSNDGTDDLTLDIGTGLENDGSDNLRVDPGGVTGNGLTEDTATTLGIASGGVDTTELADGSVTTAKVAGSAVTAAKIATDAVTGTEIDLSDIAGENITVDSTNDELDADSANMVDTDADGYLEPDGFSGIDSPVVRTPEIRDAGDSTHLTLTNGGPLTLGQTLDTDGNALTNNAGDVALGSILDLSANDLVDGGTTIWDTSTGYIPQGRLENDAVTVTAGDGLKNGGSVALGASTTLDVEPADFAGTFLSDDGTDDLTVDIGNGLENDGSDNLRVDPGGVAGNGLTEDTATTLGIASGGVDTTELADGSVTSAKVAGSAVTAAKIATDAVTGTEIDLSDIAGENITVDSTNDELDADTANMVDTDADGYLEPDGFNGIDTSVIRTPEIRDDGNSTHLTLTNGGPLTLGQTLDTDGNAITNNAGDVALGSILDLSANDLVDGGTTIWDTSAGYIPQGRLENDAVTVSVGSGLTGGGSVALGASTSVSIASGGVDTTELADGSVTTAKVAGSAITAAKIATDAVTDTEIDLNDIAGENITVDGTNGELDAASANMVESDSDGLLEPVSPYTGIDVTTAEADEIQGAGGNTHLTLTGGGPLTLGQTLDTDGNTITNNAGNVTLASVLDLSANDLADGGTTIWDTSAGYIPQGRLENDAVTVSAGDGLKNGGSIALGASTTLDIEPADFAGTFLSDDGSDDLTVDIGNGLENDGSDNLRIDPDGIAGNGLTEDTATTLGIASGGVDTTELASSSVTTAKIATDAVTGTEIDLSDIAGENITVDTTNGELDASGASPNMVDADTDDYLEPDGFSGIDSPVLRTPEIRDAGNSTHLTLTNGGPLEVAQPLQVKTNPIRFDANDTLTIETGATDRTLEIGPPASDGNSNTAGGYILGGHPNNVINGGEGVVIAGGGANNSNENTVNGNYTTVSGGRANSAGAGVGAGDATVGGGYNNSATGLYTTVAGGYNNSATQQSAAVAGGQTNNATANYATIAGGQSNDASASNATVGGGQGNGASASHATVAGGDTNTASTGHATVAGGQNNRATGQHATVPGGKSNDATGQYSLAAGRVAKTQTSGGTTHSGAFVWGDGTSTTARSQANNQFVVQASNGVYVGDDGGPGGDFYSNSKLIDTSSGAHLTTGGTWTDSSSRTVKENITPVDGPSILETVEALPVSEWSYENDDDGVRHVGPMAEDFYEAFGLGGDDKHIASLDTAGVALAAIKGLAERLETKDERLEQQADQIDDLEADREELEAEVEAKDERIDDLEARLERVEAALDLDE